MVKLQNEKCYMEWIYSSFNMWAKIPTTAKNVFEHFWRKKKHFSHGLHDNEKVSFPNLLRLWYFFISSISWTIQYNHSVHSPLSARGGMGGLGFLFRGGCYWPFSGNCSFHIKDKLKSEIFHDKRSVLTKMFFSVTKKFNIMSVHWKTLFQGTSWKTKNINWGLDSFLI